MLHTEYNQENAALKVKDVATATELEPAVDTYKGIHHQLHKRVKPSRKLLFIGDVNIAIVDVTNQGLQKVLKKLQPFRSYWPKKCDGDHSNHV